MTHGGRRTSSSVLPFAAFWAVLALACVFGLVIVRAVGLGGGTVTAPAAHAPPVHQRRSPFRPLTLASIFDPRPPSLTGYDRRKIWTLIATGDVIPARTVNWKMVTTGDFLGPFRPTAAYLRTGDITLINLESPLIDGCPVTNEGFQFCGDPRAVEGLKLAGVDTSCTANNHIGNYGDQGIQETWDHLRAAGIGYCGLGKVDHKRVRGGAVVAFLAYNCVGQRFDYAQARREIRAARRTADVVIVSVHWGKEYVSLPATEPGIADDDPVKVGHWIIDSGADLIIGNHPHHVQPVEIYHGHLIAYAHGNFVFDQMFDDPGGGGVKQGVVGTYTFVGTRLVAVRYRPVHIYDYWQPRWTDAVEGRQILAGMRAASVELAKREAGS